MGSTSVAMEPDTCLTQSCSLALSAQDVTPQQGACSCEGLVRPQMAPATEAAHATASGSRAAQEQFLDTLNLCPQVCHQA